MLTRLSQSIAITLVLYVIVAVNRPGVVQSASSASTVQDLVAKMQSHPGKLIKLTNFEPKP